MHLPRCPGREYQGILTVHSAVCCSRLKLYRIFFTQALRMGIACSLRMSYSQTTEHPESLKLLITFCLP